MEKKLVNIQEVLETDLKGQVSVRSINNLKIWLDTDKKIKLFEKYVKNMGNNCLTLDCLSYRQLVLDNRPINLGSVKKQLKCTETALEVLRNLLLEDITESEIQKFNKLSASDNKFVDNFLDYWNDRKGIPFSKLLYMYNILGKVAA